MKKLSGWQKVGLFAGIGCFSFVALLVVGFAVAVFYAKSTLADLGDTTPTQVQRTIAIQAPPAEAPPPGTKPATPTANGPMQLNVELQEGTFDIKPGEPNGRVQVEGRVLRGVIRTDTSGPRRRTARSARRSVFDRRLPRGRGCWPGSATTTITGRS